MFYCKSSTQTSCSDVHWNFWQMCNALLLGSKVCNWYQLAISPIWRRRSTIKCLKKSSLYSAFCTQPAFYSQSSVCILHLLCILALVRSLQSAVRSLPLTLTVFSVFWEPRWCSWVCCWYIWQTRWFCFKALKSPCSQLTVFIFWLLVHKTDQSTLWVIHVFLLHGGNSLFHLTLILTLLFAF